jgi:hypothetical protein
LETDRARSTELPTRRAAVQPAPLRLPLWLGPPPEEVPVPPPEGRFDEIPVPPPEGRFDEIPVPPPEGRFDEIPVPPPDGPFDAVPVPLDGVGLE